MTDDQCQVKYKARMTLVPGLYSKYCTWVLIDYNIMVLITKGDIYLFMIQSKSILVYLPLQIGFTTLDTN